jgi:DNA-binding NtrC family response regulator
LLTLDPTKVRVEDGVKTIFVLDDDQEQAELLAQALSCKAWRVRAFSDPIRALAALNTEGADLLVADLSMPWIDGGDVVASARLRRPSLRVILISGYSRGAEIAKRYNVPFLAKPIDLDALRTATQQALLPGSHAHA